MIAVVTGIVMVAISMLTQIVFWELPRIMWNGANIEIRYNRTEATQVLTQILQTELREKRC